MRYDAELAALRGGVEQVVVELVVGPRSSPTSRKAILPHMDDLAAFLGRRSVPFPVNSHQAITILPSCFAIALGRGPESGAVPAGVADSTAFADLVVTVTICVHLHMECRCANYMTN